MSDPSMSINSHNDPSLLQSRLLSQDHSHLDSAQAEQQAFSPAHDEANVTMPLETTEPAGDSLGDEKIITIREAVYKLFRFHVYDWLALITLAIISIVLNIIQPFQRFVGITMMEDLMYPLVSNVVPTATIPVISIVIPLVVFMAFFLKTRDITDFHHATLGILFASLITGVLTDVLKDAVGRPRPDFFWRCFPDGIAVYSNSTGGAVCHGKDSTVKDGYKSFPSGHASWVFAGLGFLSVYLAGKLQLCNGQGHVGKVVVILMPLLAATLVSLSQVDVYWHHWQDVFAGALLGLAVAALCYLEFFRSIFRENRTGPYGYLQLGNNLNPGFRSWFGLHRARIEPYHPVGNAQAPDLERATS